MVNQKKNQALPKVCIYGAGSIGVYVGGRLQAAGVDVSFIGRQRIADQVSSHGLRLTDWQGADIHLPADTVQFATIDTAISSADIIIVTVKSAATDEVGLALANRINPDVVVVSLQNGIGNARTLAKHLPDNPVLTAMISFNVLQRGDGHFHAGTEGELMSDPHPQLEALLPYFQAGDLPLELRADMHEVQWAKLLMNLNNALNALSGIPLHDELSQRDYRRCLVILIQETLRVLRQSNIRPARLMPVPMHVLPWILKSPDWLFARLAKQMLAIDPLARSSMWEDLEAGRVTEIDWINGEVVRQAEKVGVTAPANERVIALIRAAESGGKRDWSGVELLRELKEAV